MSFSRGFVPDVADSFEVVILFAVIGAVISGLSKVLRIHQRPLGQRHHAPHVLGTQGSRIHPGYNRGSSRRADRSVGPMARKNHAVTCEFVQMRRGGVSVAVATKMRSVVFAGEPDNIR